MTRMRLDNLSTSTTLESNKSLVGNQSANQSLSQYEASLNATLAKLQVQTAAFEKAQAAERLEEALVMEALENISTEIMRDWPRN